MLETMAVYRAKYAITDATSLGSPPQHGDRLQAQDYQLVQRARVVSPYLDLGRHCHTAEGRGPER